MPSSEFYDSSVLVAVFLGDHQHHAASLKLFIQASPERSYCAAHSVAEVFAVTTRLPLRPPIGPEQAILFLEEIAARLTLVSLSGDEYLAAITGAADKGISGGRIYDALILQCAAKVNAEQIYTWNSRHFAQIAPELADRLSEPESKVIK